jgi:hypothetical protein
MVQDRGSKTVVHYIFSSTIFIGIKIRECKMCLFTFSFNLYYSENPIFNYYRRNTKWYHKMKHVHFVTSSSVSPIVILFMCHLLSTRESFEIIYLIKSEHTGTHVYAWQCFRQWKRHVAQTRGVLLYPV